MKERIWNDEGYQRARKKIKDYHELYGQILRKDGFKTAEELKQMLGSKVQGLAIQVRYYELLKLSGKTVVKNKKMLLEQLDGIDLRDFGARLVDVRIMLGVKLRTLAKHSGLNEDNLRRWELHEYGDCPIDKALKIAESLVGKRITFKLGQEVI